MIVIVALVRSIVHIRHVHSASATKNPVFIDYVGKVR